MFCLILNFNVAVLPAYSLVVDSLNSVNVTSSFSKILWLPVTNEPMWSKTHWLSLIFSLASAIVLIDESKSVIFNVPFCFSFFLSASGTSWFAPAAHVGLATLIRTTYWAGNFSLVVLFVKS